MTVTDEKAGRAGGRGVVEELRASGGLDGLFERIDSGQVELTGSDGLLPALLKQALERGLQAELTDHLGYEKGESTAVARGNARNGTTVKTIDSEVGSFEIEVPRDRAGSFTPHLVRKGQRRMDGLDAMIISLYAGGMTVREIRHHLDSTLGVELSTGTICQDHRRRVRRRPSVAGPAAGGLLPGDLPRARSASRSVTRGGCPAGRPTSPSAWTWTAVLHVLGIWAPGRRGSRLLGARVRPGRPTEAWRTC